MQGLEGDQSPQFRESRDAGISLQEPECSRQTRRAWPHQMCPLVKENNFWSEIISLEFEF